MDGSIDAATDAGVDAGAADAGDPYVPPEVKRERSLFWTQPELVDDDAGISFAKLMAIVAPDGHGGRLLDRWFRRFATTAHSERALPAQWMDEVAATQGADPAGWDLSTLPLIVTGVHNRIDLADRTNAATGHCGELRVSFSSTHPTIQPLHLIFLFRQPLAPGDVNGAGEVTCAATARAWAELSRLDGAALIDAVRARLTAGLTRERFLMAESVELTVSPWEWRQWKKVPDPLGELPFVFDNPPLFQTVDVDALNAPGPLRDDFLAFVAENAAALNARRLLLPERFRAPSARVPQGVPRTPLDLGGLPAEIANAYPTLRQQVELVGCPACHTADADFVQTRTDRTVSPFYDKELDARAAYLEALARGDAPDAPFGPLQALPILPP